MDEIVCGCMNVTLKDIKKAIADGADSFEKVQEKTKVATGCGECEKEVRSLVDQLLNK